MQENELKAFVKQNAPYIYNYMNAVVLKEIGVMNPNYFIKLITDFFNKQNRVYNIEEISKDHCAYIFIAEVLGNKKEAFTYFRKDTMTLDELYKAFKLYFNYVKFTVKEGSFQIDFVQSKAGVTAFDEEIIKFSKSFVINEGIEAFIKKNQTKPLSAEQLGIQEALRVL